jgi:hypothetical protein
VIGSLIGQEMHNVSNVHSQLAQSKRKRRPISEMGMGHAKRSSQLTQSTSALQIGKAFDGKAHLVTILVNLFNFHASPSTLWLRRVVFAPILISAQSVRKRVTLCMALNRFL